MCCNNIGIAFVLLMHHGMDRISELIHILILNFKLRYHLLIARNIGKDFNLAFRPKISIAMGLADLNLGIYKLAC